MSKAQRVQLCFNSLSQVEYDIFGHLDHTRTVGLWNEEMTNRLTVDEGSQKLFPVIWGRFCRPVVQGRGSTQKYENSHFTS